MICSIVSVRLINLISKVGILLSNLAFHIHILPSQCLSIIIIIVKKTSFVPNSSANPNSVVHQNKIIWQSKIRLKIPSRQHVVENTRALQKISEMKKGKVLLWNNHMTVMSLTRVSDDVPADCDTCVSRPPGGLFQRRQRKVGSFRGQLLKRALSVYAVFKVTNNFLLINCINGELLCVWINVCCMTKNIHYLYPHLHEINKT